MNNKRIYTIDKLVAAGAFMLAISFIPWGLSELSKPAISKISLEQEICKHYGLSLKSTAKQEPRDDHGTTIISIECEG